MCRWSSLPIQAIDRCRRPTENLLLRLRSEPLDEPQRSAHDAGIVGDSRAYRPIGTEQDPFGADQIGKGPNIWLQIRDRRRLRVGPCDQSRQLERDVRCGSEGADGREPRLVDGRPADDHGRIAQVVEILNSSAGGSNWL